VRARLIGLGLGLGLGLGSADAGPVTTAAKGAVVDWTAGLVRAEVTIPADRHAPSPAVARGGARRKAEERARARLAAAAKALPWAAGGTVGEQLKGKDGQAALDGAVAAAIVLGADYFTDGSVRVELGLPIEAVRVAIAGPRRVEPGSAPDPGPTAIVVDATRLDVGPAVGLGLQSGGASAVGPVVFAHERPDAEQLGPRPADVKAARRKGGALVVDNVDPAAVPGALVVVMVRARP